MPDTPVKKLKTAHFVVERPWQSAFTRKVCSEEFDYLAPPTGGGREKKTGPGKKPRKSLSAAFPALSEMWTAQRRGRNNSGAFSNA